MILSKALFIFKFLITFLLQLLSLIGFLIMKTSLMNLIQQLIQSKLKVKIKMKYFPITPCDDSNFQGILKLTQQASNLIIQICKNLKLPLQAVHLSLWFFHCQVKILTFHNFDRYSYICACILAATKIGQHLRNPADILHQMRLILKKRKNSTAEDNQQITKKWMKKIFDAQVNIMINIGFDFDIQLSIHCLNYKLKQQIKNTDLIDKLKQTLTSFYKTQTVLYYDQEIIALASLDIVMKNQGISIQLSGFSQQLIRNLRKDEIKQVKSFYLKRCNIA